MIKVDVVEAVGGRKRGDYGARLECLRALKCGYCMSMLEKALLTYNYRHMLHFSWFFNDWHVDAISRSQFLLQPTLRCGLSRDNHAVIAWKKQNLKELRDRRRKIR